MITVGQLLLGKYRVLHVLGRGGMGEVYAVRHEALDEIFALKVLRSETAADPVQTERIRREARASARLRSEHAVRIVDTGLLSDGRPYLLMEHVEGRSLAGVLDERTRVPVEQAVSWVLQAASALAEAHALGVVHRDIKPSNLLLTRRSDGTEIVKVLDFGIAKATRFGAPLDTLTANAATLGSPAYMSPEQVRNAHAVTERTDVWSLGVVLYELVSGASPFFAYTTPGVFARILTDAPTPLVENGVAGPPELVEAIEALLQKDPAKRVASMVDLAELLRPLASSGDDVDRVARVALHVAEQRATPAAPEISRLDASAASAATEAPTASTQANTQAAPSLGESARSGGPAARGRSGRWSAGVALASIVLLGVVVGRATISRREQVSLPSGEPDADALGVTIAPSASAPPDWSAVEASPMPPPSSATPSEPPAVPPLLPLASAKTKPRAAPVRPAIPATAGFGGRR